MCAIAGLVCSKRQCREEDHLLLVKNMCDVQSHRGLDYNGVLSLGQVCLGSNRLSIIDLTKAGHMPMSDANDGFCVEFLGMRRQGVMEAISAWKENVHGFFNLLALEIWGRLFFLGETEEALTRQLTQGSQIT